METNKIAVVTGATDGIGLETCKELLKKGITVIGVARDIEKAKKREQEFSQIANNQYYEFVIGDLSTTKSRKILIGKIKKRLDELSLGRLDLLVHVAGTISSWAEITAEGYELTFSVNHLAVFHITNALLGSLQKSVDARVIVVSSKSHYHTKMRWNDLMMQSHYFPLSAYKQSKLANVLFVKGLASKFPDHTIKSYAVDPGLVNTNIGLKKTKGIEHLVWQIRKRKGVLPSVPAQYIVNICLDKEYLAESGEYYYEGKKKKPSKEVFIVENVDRLWHVSETLTSNK